MEQRRWAVLRNFIAVMPGLVAGIHVFAALKSSKTWMAGTSPAMTTEMFVLSAGA
jgi:hypothetical protein